MGSRCFEAVFTLSLPAASYRQWWACKLRKHARQIARCLFSFEMIVLSMHHEKLYHLWRV